MLFRDVRFALRSIFRRPGFAATVILTLALGIGANTAIFSVVNGILLNALPFESSEELVSLWPEALWQRGGFQILEERSSLYQSVAGYSLESRYSWTGRGEPRSLVGVAVTSGFFKTLGASPQMGRPFQDGDERPGAGNLVILSHSFFTGPMNSDREILGKTLQLDGVERTVVGVMPASFQFPSPEVELWIPVTMDAGDIGAYWGGLSSVFAFGRLNPGATVEQASASMGPLMNEVREAFPWPMPDDYGASATAVALREQITGDVRVALLVLLSAVVFVLLIGCVNVANLMLVRARSRENELALRAAIGAGRGRLISEMITESLVLASFGGAIGLLIGSMGVRALRRLLPDDVPRVEAIVMDSRVLLFTLGVTLITGLLFGLAPALKASRPNLATTLRENRSGSAQGKRMGDALVLVQVAATVVLAIGAGLLLRSFQKQINLEPGFEPESVLTARVAPPTFRYQTAEAQRQLYNGILDQLEGLPNVESVAVTNQSPFIGTLGGSVFLIDGRPHPTGNDWPLADFQAVVSPGFRDVLKMPLAEGRWFERSDNSTGQPVAVISRGLAERYWPGQEVIGERIGFPGRTVEWRTIIGLVEDIKTSSLTASPSAALYVPLDQSPAGPMIMMARAAQDGEPTTLSAGVRQTVRTADGDTPVSELVPLATRVADSLARERFTMLLLGAFALLAIVLAAVGIYGVTAYAVAQRQRELATRLALGADPNALMMWVLKRSVRLGAIGVAFGLPLAFVATRLLGSLVYGVSVTDPVTFVAAALVLALVAALASYLPARRALRTDPMLVLRA
ncbi:MAG: ABC transporter permease [Acidobacteriota bacterium]